MNTFIFGRHFTIQLADLPLPIQKKFDKMIRLFHQNPSHPSLRLHKLSGNFEGCWSISLDYHYRVIFQWMEGGNVLLKSIGTHQIYAE